MNRHISIVGAIVRKDFLLLWPLLALIAALQLLQITYFDLNNMSQDMLGAAAQIHLTALYVAIAVLVISVVQNDAIVSVRHDWLTKPILPLDLLIAKVIFIAVAYVAPSIVIEAIIFYCRFDASIGEALSRSAKSLEFVVALLGLGVAAIMTATILQAAGVMVGVVIVASLAFAISLPHSGLTEAFFESGAQWILQQTWVLLATALSILLLWIQYAYRRTSLTRTIFAVSVALIPMAPMFLSWDKVFAIQKSLSRDPAAAESIKLALGPQCFPSTVVNPLPENARPQNGDEQLDTLPAQLHQSIWPPEQRRLAGPGAIGFATVLSANGIPDRWKLMFARVQANYVDGKGNVLTTKTPLLMRPRWQTTAEGATSAAHFWLLPRNIYEQISGNSSVQMQINYSLSLLKPLAPFEIPVDGNRHYSPEIGYCRADADRATASVKVNCFKRGAQSALLTAEISELPTSVIAISFPNYAPSWLDFLKSRSSIGTLHHAANTNVARVKIVAYDDQVHFDRQLTVPGALGGPIGVCPAPPAT